MPLFYKRSIIALIVFLFLPALIYAQQNIIIHGVAFKKNSFERLSQVIVTNQKSMTVMMSDELGSFTIKASVGDTLIFSKYDYTPQKKAVVNSDDIAVYLQPVIKLNEVTIKGQTSKQELNEVINTYRSKGLYFDGKPPISLFSPFGGSPITGFYELFGKDARNERRFIKFSKTEQEYNEVHKRYNKQLVKNITKLPDDDIENFMFTFTPTIEDLKEWNDYQLISYIKKSLEYYQKNKGKESQKLQKLY